MRAGDVLVMESAGGGGWGDPLERLPEDVAEDVAQEYLTVVEARRRYGVELDPAGDVDAAATVATYRQRLRDERRWLRTTVTANPAYTGQRGATSGVRRRRQRPRRGHPRRGARRTPGPAAGLDPARRGTGR